MCPKLAGRACLSCSISIAGYTNILDLSHVHACEVLIGLSTDWYGKLVPATGREREKVNQGLDHTRQKRPSAQAREEATRHGRVMQATCLLAWLLLGSSTQSETTHGSRVWRAPGFGVSRLLLVCFSQFLIKIHCFSAMFGTREIILFYKSVVDVKFPTKSL